MYQLHTEKQMLYFNEVIRFHYEEGMGEDRISRILPIGHCIEMGCYLCNGKRKNLQRNSHEKAKSKAVSPAAERTRQSTQEEGQRTGGPAVAGRDQDRGL